MGDIVKFTESTVGELDSKLKGVRIERAKLGQCPVCGRRSRRTARGIHVGHGMIPAAGS